MSIKILTLVGTYIEKGNTMGVLDQFLKGLTQTKKIENHIVNVCHEEINGCHGCLGCKHHEEIYCSQHDKCYDLMMEFVEADLVIFAFPIYWFEMPAELKKFIDRTVILFDWSDFSPKKQIAQKMPNKKVICLATCGGMGYDHATYSIQQICKFLGCKYDGICFTGGNENTSILKDENKMKLAFEFGQKIANQL